MIRSTLFLAIAAFGFSAVDASAAEVQLAYKGVITQITQTGNPHASSFSIGQEITIRYVVETATPDSNPNTNQGVYYGGLREMKISIADAGVDVTTGTGTVQTFNDVGSDQAFFYGNTASGELAGLPVSHAEVDFVDWQSAMLTSDAIPSAHLLAAQNSIAFQTTSGRTYFFFQAAPEEPVATCASEGYTGTKLLWCRNICEKGYTGKTLDMWIHRWIGKYRDLPYCAAPQPEN